MMALGEPVMGKGKLFTFIGSKSCFHPLPDKKKNIQRGSELEVFIEAAFWGEGSVFIRPAATVSHFIIIRPEALSSTFHLLDL